MCGGREQIGRVLVISCSLLLTLRGALTVLWLLKVELIVRCFMAGWRSAVRLPGHRVALWYGLCGSQKPALRPLLAQVVRQQASAGQNLYYAELSPM